MVQEPSSMRGSSCQLVIIGQVQMLSINAASSWSTIHGQVRPQHQLRSTSSSNLKATCQESNSTCGLTSLKSKASVSEGLNTSQSINISSSLHHLLKTQNCPPFDLGIHCVYSSSSKWIFTLSSPFAVPSRVSFVRNLRSNKHSIGRI